MRKSAATRLFILAIGAALAAKTTRIGNGQVRSVGSIEVEGVPKLLAPLDAQIHTMVRSHPECITLLSVILYGTISVLVQRRATRGRHSKRIGHE